MKILSIEINKKRVSNSAMKGNKHAVQCNILSATDQRAFANEQNSLASITNKASPGT